MDPTSSIPPEFSQQDMKQRAIRRIAQVLLEHWEERRFPHSRLFETLMPDPWITDGISIKGGTWREHVVPCAYLARECIRKFNEGSSRDEVIALLERYLRIVLISHEERRHLDFTLGYKSTMPTGWHFGQGDPLARIKEAGIVLA